MSKNNLIKRSDKKHIRLEKSRIRRQFLDVKKQEELINELYKKFGSRAVPAEVKKVEKAEKPKQAETKKVVKKEKVKAVK